MIHTDSCVISDWNCQNVKEIFGVIMGIKQIQNPSLYKVDRPSPQKLDLALLLSHFGLIIYQPSFEVNTGWFLWRVLEHLGKSDCWRGGKQLVWFCPKVTAAFRGRRPLFDPWNLSFWCGGLGYPQCIKQPAGGPLCGSQSGQSRSTLPTNTSLPKPSPSPPSRPIGSHL